MNVYCLIICGSPGHNCCAKTALNKCLNVLSQIDSEACTVSKFL